MELVKATSVNVLPNYQLEITFSNGFCGIKDCSELVSRGVFKTLQNNHEFENAKIINHGDAIGRSEKIDLDAHGCYLDIISKPKIMSPQISSFLGIKVYMYNDDHNPPHFHVQYSEYGAVLDITNGGLINGSLPPRVRALVIERASLHQDELLKNREICKKGGEFLKIAPLE